jgi:acyl carrier protein
MRSVDTELKAGAPASGREAKAHDAAAIRSWIVAHIAAELGLDPQEIDVREPFAHYGMDSVVAVGMSGELEEWLGISLSPTLLWEYPTIASLASHLAHLSDTA